jgi:MoaA/NifB/PqqE/SkfB family radical SAM enzyme
MDNRTVERVKKSLKDCRIGPETIALMMTKNCNLNCLYCRGGRTFFSSSGEDISTQELFDLFKCAADFQVQDINLGGFLGEPFCRKDILEIIREIKRLGLRGTMTTNGSFLNSAVAKMMSDCGWDIMRISLDSADEEIQHALRPAINQKPYFQGIVEFLDTLQQIGSKIRVILNVVISKRNFRSLPGLVNFANRYKNIESLDILKLLNMGLVNYEDLRLNAEEEGEFKSILAALKNEKKLSSQGSWGESPVNGNNGLQNKDEENAGGRCFSGESRCFVNYYILSIDSDGYIMKCPQYQLSIERLNIKKIPLSTLWKNELLQFRQNLSKNAPCYQTCCTILKKENKLISDALS